MAQKIIKLMKICYKCGADVKTAKCVKEGIAMNCLKCPKCGEEYFTSSELIKFDIKKILIKPVHAKEIS